MHDFIQSRRRLTAGTVIAAALGLIASAFSAVPAVAADDEGLTSPLSLSISIDSPRATFKAGEVLTTVFTAKNTTKQSITLPDDAVLMASTATAGDGHDEISGGCESAGAGGYPYTWVNYVLELPSRVKPGVSFTCTYTHVATGADVANGGTYGILRYGTVGTSGDAWSPDLWFYMHAADGKASIALSGPPSVGKKLTVKLGYWAEWTTTASYQWYSGGKPIARATASTYTPTAADRGKEITVDVQRTNESGGWISLMSEPTRAVAAGKLSNSIPTLVGIAKVGKKLTAKAGAWTPGTTFSYQWYANGKAISKAKASSYTPTKSVAGKRLTVKVTGTKSGYAAATRTSKASKIVAR